MNQFNENTSFSILCEANTFFVQLALMHFKLTALRSYLRLLTIMFGASLIHGSVIAQPTGYELGPNILVAKEPAGRVLVEPHLAIDPKDPNRIIAVGFISPTNDDRTSAEHCAAVFLSTDGGMNWVRKDLPGNSCADPWVSITSKGLAVVTVIGRHPSLQGPGPHLMAFVSSDTGLTWGNVPQSLGGGHDGSRSIAAPDGTLYILSGRAKRDGDQILRFPLFVGRIEPGLVHVETLPEVYPSNLQQISDGLAVLSDGSLVITYDDFQRKANGGFRSRAGALKGRRSWAMVSKNRGQTFSMPLFVTEECWTRPTFLAADNSNGPFKDRLYYVCEGDSQREILLTFSADHGEEWSDAAPIELAAKLNGSRTEPQLAVNQKGVLGIAWMDRRDDPNGKCYAPYFTASTDGGVSFSKPIKVSTALSCPDFDRLGFTGRRFNSGGDYFGLAADERGRFHLLWPDAREGLFELWTSSVIVK